MKKNYKHKTTGQECNAAQYIAEMVCLREAEKQRVGRPAYALWNTDKWQKKFKSQVTKAYGLLKKYSDKAIINALNSQRGKNIYSLRVKFLEPIIKKEQEAIDKLEAKEIKEVKYEDNTLQKPRKGFGKKTLFSKLEGLDNE
tara:strand:+ start:10351 stop:10776 length:426 start_codon:yes stop_codon:yes gene_type:complete